MQIYYSPLRSSSQQQILNSMQTRWFYNMYCKYVIVHKMFPWFILECHFGRLSYFEFLARNSQIQDFFLSQTFQRPTLHFLRLTEQILRLILKNLKAALNILIFWPLWSLFQNQLFHTFQPFISERTIIYKYRNIITYFYDLIVIMTAPGNWYWNWPKNCNFFNFLSRDFFLFLNSRDLD